MTEQTNAELIAEAQAFVTDEYITPDTSREEALIRRLAERLEAADQRAELAEADLSVEESKNAGYRAKNNQLAAVVEKVRESIPLSNPELIEAGYAVPAEDLIDILATAPAGILREHDAALIEGLADEWSADPDAWGDNEKDYRNTLREKARQRREEQS